MLPETSSDELYKALSEVAPKIIPYACVTWELLNQIRHSQQRILFEGAQGAMLDVDHGTYPYVSLPHTRYPAKRVRGVGSGRLKQVMC